MRAWSFIGVVALSVALSACSSEKSSVGPMNGPGLEDDAQVKPELIERLLELEAVTSVVEEECAIEGYRQFVLTFRQPEDHHLPLGAAFEQRAVLLYASDDA